ncbi:uncharacterized protein LOC118463103 [Anopheles albimanus]|uniref:uncharacterized protein LOC118463103 n=1 Tax=Anopheles albimanus TaxID=7167 RepID=UPI00163FE787|nr:uncharacterized protein LOC118463103 [Anopheles albimanus]
MWPYYRKVLPLALVLVLSLAVSRYGATISNAGTGAAVRENSLLTLQEEPAANITLPPAVGSSTASITNVNESDTTIRTTTVTASVPVLVAETVAPDTPPSTIATELITAPSTTLLPSSTPAKPATSTTTTTDAPYSGEREFPSNCSEFNASPIQLLYTEKARMVKCCPPGQMIQPQSDFRFECVTGTQDLKIETIEAHFYGNNECIEVSEKKITLPVVSEDRCGSGSRNALMYSADQGDELYVLQNGSLLVLELGSLVSVFESYCVEMTTDDQLVAKVCEEEPESRAAFVSMFIWIGITVAAFVLLATMLSYTFVPKLNDTFGCLIACHAGCLAIGTVSIGLARCDDHCIARDTLGIAELFANAFLGTAVFAFFLMNVLNTVYVAYYIPNGLEYDSKNKRDMYVFLAVLYTISLVPLVLLPKGGLLSIVFIYYGCIAVAQALSTYYTRRLTSGIYLHINDTVSGQTKINHIRLNDISKQTRLCRMYASFTLVCWIVFTVLMLTSNMTDFPRIFTVYSIVVQGLFTGVVFVAGSQKWTIIRECWSNSGSADLRVLENGFEMRPLGSNRRAPRNANDGNDDGAVG